MKNDRAGVSKPYASAALIRAARPNHEDSEKMIALEARCRRLQDELDTKDGEHERSLRGLQQAHLKFKSAMAGVGGESTQRCTGVETRDWFQPLIASRGHTRRVLRVLTLLLPPRDDERVTTPRSSV